MTRRLLLLNGLAVLGSVIYHATAWGFTSLFWWTDRYAPVSVPNFAQLGGTTYYGLRILETLITFSLPAFVFVAGFFVAVAAGREPRVGWARVLVRIKTLLIPYVLWSLAIFVGRGLEGITDTPTGYLAKLLFGRAAIPYYYVPAITQLYLLSPWIAFWLKSHWTPVLIAAGVLQLGVQLACYPVLLGWDVPVASWVWRHVPGWFFPHMAFWFVFGTFAGLHGGRLKEWVARWKGVLPWVTAALGLAALLEWELLLRLSSRAWLEPLPTAVDSLYSGAFILTFFAFADIRVPARRQLDALGERSLGVYLIHPPVLELFSRASYHLTPLLLGHQLLFQPLLIAAGVGVPLLLMTLVRRSPARPCYNYLFG